MENYQIENPNLADALFEQEQEQESEQNKLAALEWLGISGNVSALSKLERFYLKNSLKSNNHKVDSEIYGRSDLLLSAVAHEGSSRTITTKDGPVDVYKASWLVIFPDGSKEWYDTYSLQPYETAKLLVEEMDNNLSGLKIPVMFYPQVTKRNQKDKKQTTFVKIPMPS